MSGRFYRKKKPRGKPGPGAYKPKFRQVEKSKPSFSVQGKTPKKQRRKAPGPGKYHQNRNSSCMGTPTSKFGSGNRLGFYKVNNVPGPGKYRPRPSSASTNKRDPRMVFGKSVRGKKRKKNVPGPGTYRKKGFTQINKIKQRGNAMKPKRPQSASFSMTVPGPGTYTPNLKHKKAYKRVKFGKDKRDRSRSKKVPGPGTYSPSIIKFKNAKRTK